MEHDHYYKPAFLAGLTSLPGPDKLVIRALPNLPDVFSGALSQSFGASGVTLFGTAFIQGERLCFTTAMAFRELLDICKPDRAKAHAGVGEVTEHSNRPKDTAHAMKLRKYLMNHAAQGEKFILPSFTLSYGVDGTGHEDAPQVILTINVMNEAALWWPAVIFIPKPPGERTGVCELTDGAHREGEIEILLSPKSKLLGEAEKSQLANNAADVRIIFETESSQQHQDFADCGKAKPISRSLVATWDIRDRRNLRCVELVKAVPFLKNNVEATANNVNLSLKSKKIWSMSAVRMFVQYASERHPAAPSDEDAKKMTPLEQVGLVAKTTQGAEAFFDQVIKHVPALAVLNSAKPDVTVPDLRDRSGGNVMLRGIGMAILARAFVYAANHGNDFAEVARKLAKVEWHLLDKERKDIPAGEGYFAALHASIQPHWRALLAVGQDRYRISASSNDADAAWRAIMGIYFDEPMMLAAQ